MSRFVVFDARPCLVRHDGTGRQRRLARCLEPTCLVVALASCGSRTGFDESVAPSIDSGIVRAPDAMSTLVCNPGDPLVDIVHEAPGIQQFVIAADVVYYSTRASNQDISTIWTVPLAGGAAKETGVRDWFDVFATDGESFFWGLAGVNMPSTIRARSISGGPLRDLVPGQGWSLDGLVVDGSDVFVSVAQRRLPDGGVFRIDKRGANAPTQLDTGLILHGPIVAQDADAIYTFDETELKRFSKRSHPTESMVFSFGTGTVLSVATDGTRVAFAKWLGGVGEIRAIPNFGGDQSVLATTRTRLADVVIDGEVVYWFDGSALRKSSMSRPNVVTVINGLREPSGLVVGTSCAVFQQGGRVITRVAK